MTSHKFYDAILIHYDVIVTSQNIYDVIMTSRIFMMSLLIYSSLPPSLPPSLSSTRELVRKKAIMAMHHFFLLSPGTVSHLEDDFRRVLSDKDPGVMEASLILFHDLVKVGGAKGYSNMSPPLVRARRYIDHSYFFGWFSKTHTHMHTHTHTYIHAHTHTYNMHTHTYTHTRTHTHTRAHTHTGQPCWLQRPH